MILDERSEFCDGTTITATVANGLIGDVVDLGATPTTRDLGLADIWLVISIDSDVTSNGSATVTFTLLSDSTANLATSATTHFTSAAIAKASLTAGSRPVCIKLPSGSYERYLGIFAETKVQTLNAGTCSAFLTTTPPANTSYPDGL